MREILMVLLQDTLHIHKHIFIYVHTQGIGGWFDVSDKLINYSTEMSSGTEFMLRLR